MKKLLFPPLLATKYNGKCFKPTLKRYCLLFAVLSFSMISKADLYIWGSATCVGWGYGEETRSPVAMVQTDANTFIWVGYLTSGNDDTFKFPNGPNAHDTGYFAQSGKYELKSGDIATLSNDNSGDKQFRVSEEGMWKIVIKTNTSEITATKLSTPTLSSDYYQIASLSDYYWYAGMMTSNKDDNNDNGLTSNKARLTTDLTFTSTNPFFPIGCYTNMYNGEFDGGSHTIDGIKVTEYNDYKNYALGFIRFATVGANVHDLRIGANSSFSGKRKVGGIIGRIQDTTDTGGQVQLTNVVNAASITATGSGDNGWEGNAGGLFACATNNVYVTANNCANLGTISGQDGQCATFAGWTSKEGDNKTTFTNCWNYGTISTNNMDSNKNLSRMGNGGSCVEFNNCYDVTGVASHTQGTKLSADTKASGELCFRLNGKNKSTNAWRQNLGIDDYPVPFTSHSALSVSANNGWYEVSQPWQLCWLAQSHNGDYSTYNSTYREANIKLTNDIDYTAYTDQTAMIGTTDRLFGGTFDGQCHAVTIAFNNTANDETGLFRQISGGTVKNLEVKGNITTTKKFAGGICASIYISGTIINCESAVTITDEGTGDATHGGIVACVHNVSDGKEVKVENCLFSGAFNALGRTGCAAIVGWTNNDTNVKVNNCLVTGTLGFSNNSANGVFVRSIATVNGNNYFTSDVTSLGSINKSKKTRTTAGINTGELCFKLNGNTSGAEQWYQTIGTDNTPTPFSSSSKIYRNGSTGSYTYANVSITSNKASIGDSKELIAFAKLVNGGQTTLGAELTADIDMTGMDYTPIGTSTNKYKGTFDGHNHTVMLAIENSENNQALFGVVTGGTNSEIKNLVIAGSVKATAKVAGVIGYADGGNTITLTNVINTASIESTGSSDANAAGLVGCAVNNTTINATNCANTGSVKGQNEECAALAGYSSVESSFTRCYNTGTISNMQDEKNLCRGSFNFNDNCFDASNTSNPTQGTILGAAAATTGELCYKLNGEAQGGEIFFQTIGTDSYPVPFSSNKKVYQYNTSKYVNDGDKVEIGSPTDLANFATLVNAGATSVNADQTADIDFSTQSAAGMMIGTDVNDGYSGTYDGQTHEVKVTYTSSANNTALFQYISNANLRNIVTTGSITASGEHKCCGGIFAAVENNSDESVVENCLSYVNFTYSDATSRDKTFGGIGAYMRHNGTIKNCAFFGSFNASNANGNGGILGYAHDGTVTVKNCYVNALAISVESSGGHVIVRHTTPTNCYYVSNGNLNVNNAEHVDNSAITSGELCYRLNGSVDNGTDWYQDLSEEGYPIPFGTKTVAAGKWFKSSDNDVYYNKEGDDYTVYQLNMSDTQTEYNVPDDGTVTAKNVKMARNLSAGKWNTFCSPVALPKDGNFSAIKELTGVSVNGDHYTMTFSDASSIVAGKPYMVQVSEDKTEFTATDAIVANAASSSENYNGLTFTGVFTSGYAPQSNEDNSYFIISNNAFYEVDSEVSLKAFRGYITVAGAGEVKALSFDFEDMGDGINSLTPALSEGEGAIYNVAGQRIQKMQKGINIVNGKKIMK